MSGKDSFSSVEFSSERDSQNKGKVFSQKIKTYPQNKKNDNSMSQKNSDINGISEIKKNDEGSETPVPIDLKMGNTPEYNNINNNNGFENFTQENNRYNNVNGYYGNNQNGYNNVNNHESSNNDNNDNYNPNNNYNERYPNEKNNQNMEDHYKPHENNADQINSDRLEDQENENDNDNEDIQPYQNVDYADNINNMNQQNSYKNQNLLNQSPGYYTKQGPGREEIRQYSAISYSENPRITRETSDCLKNAESNLDWVVNDPNFNRNYFKEFVSQERSAFNKHSKSLKIFGHNIIDKLSEEELFDKVTNYQSNEFKVRFIDVLISLINLIEVCLFYNEHFTYIDNGYELDDTENMLRWAFLGLSVVTVILIITRYNKLISNLKILVQLEAEKPTALGPKMMKSRRICVIVESILHILQPYPYLEWHFDMEIVGNNVIYSLNMFLYFLSTLRLYYILKLIYEFNVFGSIKSKRLLEFYSKNSHSKIFLVKANLDYRGFLTLIFIALCFLVYFSLLLKVLEYFEHDLDNPFYYVVNSVWYLLVTMGTIGYGDITPKTVIGRIIGACVCLVGVVVLSLIVVTLTIFTYLDSDEQNAYTQIINKEKSKVMKQKIFGFAGKKILNFMKVHLKKVDLNSVIDTFDSANDRLDCKNFMQKEKEAKDLQSEFVTSLRYIADKHLPNIIDGLGYIWDFEDNFEDYLTTNDNLFEAVKESKNTMLSCLNLAKCLMTVGSVKNIKNINEIQHKKALSDLEFQKAKNKYKDSIYKNKKYSMPAKDILKCSNKLLQKIQRNTIAGPYIGNMQANNDIAFENNEGKKSSKKGKNTMTCIMGNQLDIPDIVLKKNKEEDNKKDESEDKSSDSIESLVIDENIENKENIETKETKENKENNNENIENNNDNNDNNDNKDDKVKESENEKYFELFDDSSDSSL